MDRNFMMENWPPFISSDGSSYGNTLERYCYPLYAWDPTQQHHSIPQDNQGENMKVEVKEEDEKLSQRCYVPCKEEEIPIEISSKHLEDTRIMQRDIKTEEEKEEEGYMRIKEEESPVEISTDGPSNRITPGRCPYPLYSWHYTDNQHNIQDYDDEKVIKVQVKTEDEEETDMSEEEPCNEEEIPPEISSGVACENVVNLVDDTQRSAIAIMMLGVMAMQQQSKKYKKRRIWNRKLLPKPDKISRLDLIRELQEDDPNDFRNYLQMPDESFQQLLYYVTPLIQKKDTFMRQSITAEQRLIATLRFLATGRCLEDLKFSTGISAQSLGRIIPETCHSIVKVLQEEYIQFPNSAEEWQATAKEFLELWNFPNCGGAIDGKHVRISPPSNSGSYYCNYKGYFSIVVLAIVNAKCEFMFLDVGKNGRNADGGAIENTEFYNRLRNDTLNLPTTEETEEGLNFVFVADDAFVLGEHILKPFPMNILTPEQKIFNHRLSRAKRVVEKAFGVMSDRFRIFQTAINLSPQKIDIIVLCCCILHNFLARTAQEYMPQSILDGEGLVRGNALPGEWRNECEGLAPAFPRVPSNNARQNRTQYMEYFLGPGAVAWQNSI